MPSINRITIIGCSLLLLILLLMGVWYANRNNQQAKLAFDPARQLVPKDASALEVPQALASLNFSKPLPFFDERNVVQSLILNGGSTSTLVANPTPPTPSRGTIGTIVSVSPRLPTSTFISYRIFGQREATIQNALIEYFQRIGWNVTATSTPRSGVFASVFSSNKHQDLFITLVEAPARSDMDQPTVIVTLRMQMINSLNR